MTAPAGRRRAIALMFCATLAWPALEMSGVSLMDTHHAMQVVFFRYAAHLAILLAILLPTRGLRSLKTQRPFLQLFRGACMFGMPACYALAADFTPSAWIWSVFWTMPALALFMAVIFLRERPHLFAWIAVALGFVGATAIRGGTGGGPLGTLIALGMASTFAAYVVLSRVLRDEPLSASLFYTAVGAFIPTVMVVWKVWTPPVPGDLFTMMVVGAFSLVILSLLDLSLEAGTVALTAPLLCLVPIWETLAVVPLRHVLPSTTQVVGIAAILIGALLWFTRQRQTVAPAAERNR